MMQHDNENTSLDKSGGPPDIQSTSSDFYGAIHSELTIDSDVLFIAFGSLRLEHKSPPFEFVGVFKDIPAKKIFVRDPYHFWYQRGLPGVANNLTGVGNHLRSLIDQQPVKKVVTFGGSMGGYAALYFGWHIGADVVHAFAPKTFLSPLRRVLYGDFRRGKAALRHPFNRQLGRLQLNRQVDKKYFDLKKVLLENNGKSKYYIYYNRNHRLDRIHCERMNGISGIELHAHDYRGHHVVQDLKEEGVLEQIIRGSL